MKLQEYQSRLLLAQYGVAIPPAKFATTPQEVHEFVRELGASIIIKPEIEMTEPRTAEFIQYANDPGEALNKASMLLGTQKTGVMVDKVFVEAVYDIIKQIYLGITIDESSGMAVMTTSIIEGKEPYATLDLLPTQPASEVIHPYLGLHDYQGRNLASSINLPYEHWPTFSTIASNFAKCFLMSDATFAEINPLIITSDQQLITLGANIYIDNYALFRHSDLMQLAETSDHKGFINSRVTGLHHTKLDGQIGCIANGAGLAMATLDAVHHYGGNEIRPASVVDIGTETRESNLQKALEMIISPQPIRAILINLFGVITPCDQIARILLRTIHNTPTSTSIVIRLAGQRANEGFEIIDSANAPNIQVTSDISDAARMAVEVVHGDQLWQS